MPTPFTGPALPLDQAGISEVTDRLRIGAAELWAVLNVETRGCGFLQDRRPDILFERHIFSRETGHRFDAAHPDISNQQQGGYGAGGAAQYPRLARAIALDRSAALDSASWGIGQVMGFNAKIAGYADVETMVTAMTQSENDQLQAFAGEVVHNGLDKALRAHHWAQFALGYNGKAFAKNKYDIRLEAAFQKYAHGALPDLAVRTAQVYLTYLRYNPGPVDGLPGRFTYSALNEFQKEEGLAINNEIGADILARLKEKSLTDA